MATLQNTSINGNLDASTSATSPFMFSSSAGMREYRAQVFIPSSANNPTNFVNLFRVTQLYNRMAGQLYYTVYQSQIHQGSLTFMLDEAYGLQQQVNFNTGYTTFSKDGQYLRATNTVGTTWGNGNYYFVLWVTNRGGFDSPNVTWTRTR